MEQQRTIEKNQKYDQNLYSRQVAAYGEETQSKLIQMKCFLMGLRGLGVEVAKNLILAGPSSLHIYDPEVVKINDLGSNFYFKPDDIGKVSRAEASLKQLSELNPNVDVKIFTANMNPSLLSEYDMVIVTDCWDLRFIKELNEAVREKNHGFIYGHVSGLFGSVFVDHSENFIVSDSDGENIKSAIISHISQEELGTVTVHEDKPHGFQDGDTIVFNEVKGMKEINQQKFMIKVKSPFVFEIGDTRNFSQYQRDGVCEQTKILKQIKFKSFHDSLNMVQMELDWEKIGRPELLHLVYKALLHFIFKYERAPILLNDCDAQQILDISKQINNQADSKANIDDEVVKNIALYFHAQISPLVSFWGGIIAQEVIKYTGKFTPIQQWFHNEFYEALPDNKVNRDPLNSQYDDFIAIFGQEALIQIHKCKAFMIGAGALGCEFIKMFALLGLGVKHGQVMVTDDDNIEISNLNRQFLFRKYNIGQNKATIACQAGRKINKFVKFTDIHLKLDKESEQTFNDQFWEDLDIVVNAVDNVHARRYIDDQCCYYEKPMFESGTLGTKCNSQVVIPRLTQSYNESQDPPEEQIPMCTIKNFPNLIEHTIQWARDYFQGIFVDGSVDFIRYQEDPQIYLRTICDEFEQQPRILRPRLEQIRNFLRVQRFQTFESCVELSRQIFQDIFCNQIIQLLHTFPIQKRTKEGQLFWSNPKRPPVQIHFNPKDQLHLQFIQSSSNIFAFMFDLNHEDDTNKINMIINTLGEVSEFHPKTIQIQENDKDNKEEKSEDDQENIKLILEELQKIEINKQKQIRKVVFEKDDSSNWHIDFISSVSNLRARNYKISEVPMYKVKLIAGQIIPALATTTATIVGAVGLEIIKYILKKDVSKIKNAFINLALPLFLFSQPIPPKQHEDQSYNDIFCGPVKAIPANWTAWDYIKVQGPLTVEQFIEHFATKYQVNISSISIEGRILLFTSYPPPKKQFLQLDLKQACQIKMEQQISQFKKYIDLVVGGDCIVEYDHETLNAEIAPVKYQY